MRILLVPRALTVGGSQITAINLGAWVARGGHQVFVLGEPGPLVALARRKGLTFVAARTELRPRPSPVVCAKLLRVCRTHAIDLVHTYHPYTLLEAFAVRILQPRVALVHTTMEHQPLSLRLPRVPLVVGFERLCTEYRQLGWDERLVHAIDARIDLEENSAQVLADAMQQQSFFERHGLDPDSVKLVMVTRLDWRFKRAALETAFEGVRRLVADGHTVQLVIVGGGPSFDHFSRRAADINAALAAQVVIMPGQVEDPAPFYATADIVLGMGSSILRAMAFGKPCILIGFSGRSVILSEENMDHYRYHSFGHVESGGEPERSVPELVTQVGTLCRDREQRLVLGRLMLKTARERFDIRHGAVALERIYLDAVQQQPCAGYSAWLQEAAGLLPSLLVHKMRRRLRGLQPAGCAGSGGPEDGVRAAERVT